MSVTFTKETYVNVYELDREYGGPEEGGWWFNSGQIVESRHVSTEAVETVQAQLEEKYPSTGQLGSVVYRGGADGVYWEDDPGADFPTETPYYE